MVGRCDRAAGVSGEGDFADDERQYMPQQNDVYDLACGHGKRGDMFCVHKFSPLQEIRRHPDVEVDMLQLVDL